MAHPEAPSSRQEGALHFRPPLPVDAAGLTVRLGGPTAWADIGIDLAPTGAR